MAQKGEDRRKNQTESVERNPLGKRPVNQLLLQFAVPSIVAMLVGSLYNIVDQFFIGRSVGELGNAATNISFPLSISCVALALLFGVGGASAFNISMGENDRDRAVCYLGNAVSMMLCCGIVLCVLTELFLDPLMRFFGSPDEVLGYAKTYTRIVALGFPFLIFTTGGGHLIRADGRPKIAMICNLTGALINTVLDAAFVFGLHLGMAGAAAATVIGQVISGVLAFWFLYHCRTVKIRRQHLMWNRTYIRRIVSLGAAPCSNQLAMMVVQIVMNQSLNYYGARSVYGQAIPIACVGIITKVNQIYISFVVGISQGMQPITSFNYGARKYHRVRLAYRRAATYGAVTGATAFLLFQLVPRQIISIFGIGTEAYVGFAVRYFRIFLFFTFINFMQIITSNFFTSIGKPARGMFLSLTRQIIFFLPMLVLLPIFMGIDGILYVGPIADFMAAAAAIFMITREFRDPRYKEAGSQKT